MHGPGRASPVGLLPLAGQHSAPLLGTPPHRVGNSLLRKGRSRPSSNETVAMRDSAIEPERI